MSIPTRKPGTGKMAEFCPSLWGGKNWPPIAFSPQTRMIYIPANENLCGDVDRRPVDLHGRPAASPARRPRSRSRRAPITSAKCRRGTSTPASACGRTTTRPRRTGVRCSRRAAAWCSAAAPTIACSTPSTRRAASCCGSSRPTRASSGQPASSCVDGKQYIAVQSGWGIDARGMQARLNARFAWQVSRSAGRRRGLGVRGEIAAR